MSNTDPDVILHQHFGLDTFRPGQREIIDALLAGRSALAVFPTGGGKSLCYQLPALLFDGLTLVVSPLIALMKDQVDRLQGLGIAAARLDSTLDAGQARALYEDLAGGRLKLLYVSPERLGNERLQARLAQCRISLLAIDEAHCISEWGHNFRPDYLKLARLAERLRAGRVLALTATATPAVSLDIRRRFGIDAADHAQTSVRRDNLQLTVTPCPPEQRSERLLQRLRQRPGEPAIVYVTLQDSAETVAAQLRAGGLSAACYHAGMDSETRAEVQNRFMAGALDIVVATIAFGMGIDKADIRAIYHYNLPKSLENYMQEIGRAGRDGAPARCEWFAAADDLRTLANFSYGDTPSRDALAALLAAVLAQPEQFSLSSHDWSQRFDIRPLVLATALTYLELDGVIEATAPFYSGCRVAWLRDSDCVDALDPRRAAFVRSLLNSGKRGRRWLTLELDVAVSATGGSRERVQNALNWMEDQGWIEVQPSGLRQGYRRLDRADHDSLLDGLQQAFERREQNDIGRLQQVLDFATASDCLPAALQQHFGEPSGPPCGHCSSCREPTPRTLPAAPPHRLDAHDLAQIDRLLACTDPELQHPRQLARYLCGLPSPATTQARRRKAAGFAALAQVAFPQLLQAIELRRASGS